MYRNIKVNLNHDARIESVLSRSGQLWTDIVVNYNRNISNNLYESESIIKFRYKEFEGLHSQSIQAVIERFFSSRKTTKALKKTNPNTKYPYKRKSWYQCEWKKQGIRHIENNILLSLPHRDYIMVPWNRTETPVQVKITRDKITHKPYALFTIKIADVEQSSDTKILGVDVGEKVLAGVSDGENQILFSSKLLRSKVRYRHRMNGSIAQKQSNKQKKSRSWRKLQSVRDRKKIKIGRQIEHILHCQSKNLADTAKNLNIGKVVFGDLRTLRNGKKGQTVNNNFYYGNFVEKCAYKLESVGIASEKISEAYTSMTCPHCLHKNKLTDPQGKSIRIYRCDNCGIVMHRDIVGAVNIWKKANSSFDVSCSSEACSWWLNPPSSVKPKCCLLSINGQHHSSKKNAFVDNLDKGGNSHSSGERGSWNTLDKANNFYLI